MALSPKIKKQSSVPDSDEPAKSGLAVAADNELNVLKSLHLFGHLRRTEIAMAVWPNSPRRSAYMMACKTVVRLLDKKMILEKPNSLGQTSLVLATKGVKELAKIDIITNAGFDLSCAGAGFFHRTFGNCFLIDRARNLDGHVYGEYAIQKNWSPLKLEHAMSQFKKYPDGLIIYEGKEHGLREGYYLADWVEVEHAVKYYDEVEKSFNLLTKKQELNESGTVLLNHLLFLVDSRTNHARRLAGFLKKYLEERPSLNRNVFLDNIFIVSAEIDIPLVWKSYNILSIRDVRTKSGFDLNQLAAEF